MTYRIVEKGVIVLAAVIPLLVMVSLFASPAPTEDVMFDSAGELAQPTRLPRVDLCRDARDAKRHERRRRPVS